MGTFPCKYFSLVGFDPYAKKAKGEGGQGKRTEGKGSRKENIADRVRLSRLYFSVLTVTALFFRVSRPLDHDDEFLGSFFFTNFFDLR